MTDTEDALDAHAALLRQNREMERSEREAAKTPLDRVLDQIVADAEPYGFDAESVLGMLRQEASMAHHLALNSMARGAKKTQLHPETVTKFARIVLAAIPASSTGSAE